MALIPLEDLLDSFGQFDGILIWHSVFGCRCVFVVCICGTTTWWTTPPPAASSRRWSVPPRRRVSHVTFDSVNGRVRFRWVEIILLTLSNLANYLIRFYSSEGLCGTGFLTGSWKLSRLKNNIKRLNNWVFPPQVGICELGGKTGFSSQAHTQKLCPQTDLLLEIQRAKDGAEVKLVKVRIPS